MERLEIDCGTGKETRAALTSQEESLRLAEIKQAKVEILAEFEKENKRLAAIDRLKTKAQNDKNFEDLLTVLDIL